MADDLGAPLGLATGRRRWWRQLPFGLVGGIAIGVVATVMGVWVLFIDDPNGGEPTAVVRIDRSKTGIPPAEVAVAGAPRPANADGSDLAAAPHAGPGPKVATSGGDRAVEPAQPVMRVPEAIEGQPLSTTPVQRVAEKTRFGILPRIASDGSRPLDVYARPVPRRAAANARVVLIVGGLGISQTGTQEALRVLGPEVTLAFAPYGASLDRWTARARGDGHELLLQVPMEPFDYPDNDPGPHTLLTGLDAQTNAERLQFLLGRLTNYVGVINYMGAKFTSNDGAFGATLKEIGGRGLMYVDDGSSSRSLAESGARAARTPFARADVLVDAVPADDMIEARLAQLEQMARSKGLAIGVASALPVTLRHLERWTKSLEARGITLVPVSAAARANQG
ncbi:MAG: divergent polysaccharide deacetylase family protein [Siculibacillus sp.]|nr:divergent polysaccharide deacetylase family protein [Siculibacillus sp.]